MKGNDVLVLVELVTSSTQTPPTYNKLAQRLNISSSQVFESVERCVEMGLLSKDRRSVELDKFLDLLTHALPYLFPLRLGGPAKGLALETQPMDQRMPGHRASAKMVWPTDDPDGVDGLTVEPLARKIPALSKANPRMHQIYSCIEILRLPDHPFKGWAGSSLEKTLTAGALQPRGELKDGELNGIPRSFDHEVDGFLSVATHYLATYGFRDATFDNIAKVTGTDAAFIRKHFQKEAELFEAVGWRLAGVVGQFLGRLMVRADQISMKDLREVVDGFLTFNEQNQDFFRLVLWGYLQPEYQPMQLGYNEFLHQMDVVVVRASKQKNSWTPLSRGYVYTLIPFIYACFLWGDSNRIAKKELLGSIGKDLKAFLLDRVLPALIEVD